MDYSSNEDDERKEKTVDSDGSAMVVSIYSVSLVGALTHPLRTRVRRRRPLVRYVTQFSGL